jgi:uncharacterized protein YbjQ (UPF0145 family)
MTRSNKYIDKIDDLDKQAAVGGMLGAAGVAHVAQNLSNRFALRSKSQGKALAESFANGIRGGHKGGAAEAVKRGLRTVVAPDLELMHKAVNELGHKMKGQVEGMHPRAKVGLRMLSEGRAGAYQKLQGRIPEEARLKAEGVAKGLGLPTSTTAHKDLAEIWKSPKHPLLSNVVAKLGRGRPSANLVAGHHPSSPGLVSSAALTVAEPVAGAITGAKMLAETKAVQGTTVGKKFVDKVRSLMVAKPAAKGFNQGQGVAKHTALDKLKESAMDFGVSSTSASIQRTSRALGAVPGAEHASTALGRLFSKKPE